MKSKALISAILFFLFGWLSIHSLLSNQSFYTKENSKLIYIFPERLRSFIAARLWEKADHLMHQGPIVSEQKFIAGSYAGNTDIIPYIKMVIALCPEETAPYRLLASNYAYHLNMEDEAVKTYEQAISNCSKSPYLHEIYASLAFIHLFSLKRSDPNKIRDELEQANANIDKAIACYNENKNSSDQIFKIDNYYTIRSRILWELEKPEQALLSWQMSGIHLEESQDKLALLLMKYKNTGIYEKLKFSEEEPKESIQQNHSYNSNKTENQNHICHHDHDHEEKESLSEKYIHENQKSPLSAFLRDVMKAGLIAVLTIILYFLYSKSFGTGSSSFRFFAGK